MEQICPLSVAVRSGACACLGVSAVIGEDVAVASAADGIKEKEQEKSMTNSARHSLFRPLSPAVRRSAGQRRCLGAPMIASAKLGS